ncbi:MAG: phenylacetate-CoA oxygenase/reductase subunit PaaK [Schleiferiaceae bacterium]|nr:phenylacetate-CoA oxygenase/reductase subunit PaaK [Schleiferiaceae bacterium]
MLGFFKKKSSESLPGLLTTKAAQKGIKPNFYPAEVINVRRETEDCVSVSFAIPDESIFSFVPGQYLTLKTQIDGQEVRRSYSLCSSPLSGELRVAIKQVESGVFSTWANQHLKAGEQMEMMPPMGQFLLEVAEDDQQTYVGFAAGSGITPVLSILKTLLARAPQSKFILFYGNRKSQTIIFKSELEDLKDQYMGRLEVHHVLSREDQGNNLLHGRIDEARTRAFTEQIAGIKEAAGHFLCGPEEMIHGVTAALSASGVAKSAIHFELFTAASPSAASSSQKQSKSSVESHVTVILDGEETHFHQGPKDFVLDAALDAGADVPYACKGAVCCTCRAKVLEGEVEMAMNYSLTDDEVADGYVLTCQTMPRSERVRISYDD